MGWGERKVWGGGEEGMGREEKMVWVRGRKVLGGGGGGGEVLN